MKTLTYDDVTKSSEGLFRFVTEASDLGLRAGDSVPRSIPTTMGNGEPFVLVRAGEDASRYMQWLGCLTLTVFND